MSDPFSSYGKEVHCKDRLTVVFRRVAEHLVVYIGMVVLCNGLHYYLKPYSQPRITSDLFVGLFIGNLHFLTKLLDISIKTIRFIIDFGMICYMFVLGIEMDPRALFRIPTRDAQFAYAGILSTLILAGSIIPFLDYSINNKLELALSISTAISSTASPVLTRLLNNLKIGKSDIGRLVTNAGMHSDLVCTLILSIGYIVLPFLAYTMKKPEDKAFPWRPIVMIIVLLVQIIFTAKVSPIFLNWVDNENPEGKPMKVTHLVLSLAFMALVCSWSPAYGYSPILSAFLSGVCLPRECRVPKWVISKVNYLLSTLFYPMFFFWMGYEADLRQFKFGQWGTWTTLFLLIIIVIAGKVVGAAVCGLLLGFQWPESVAIGLLLTTKGHFHIYLAISAKEYGATPSTSIGMVIAIIFTVLHGPTVVDFIIKLARERVPARRMALELLNPKSELRIMLCIHGTQNVPTAINFMEISRGREELGMLVYLTDMVELTDKIAATLEQAEGEDSVTVHDKEAVAMRNEITSSFEAYMDENGNGIILKRLLALSEPANMAQKICNLGEELMTALILLPVQQNLKTDAAIDRGNTSSRYVIRKVLKNAPCSVGVLVDRGFGTLERISRSDSAVSCNVAVIFIGGKDDREALAYASRVSWHPGVRLTVVRFLLNANSVTYGSKFTGLRSNSTELEEEMKHDDECFAQFYERYVAGRRVSYVEKHLANSSETYSILRSLVGKYSLIIVGRGGRVNSQLTKGMNDWQQCPELGTVGDVLAGPDFASNTSVLIIQQHTPRGELDGLDEEFSMIYN